MVLSVSPDTGGQYNNSELRPLQRFSSFWPSTGRPVESAIVARAMEVVIINTSGAARNEKQVFIRPVTNSNAVKVQLRGPEL